MEVDGALAGKERVEACGWIATLHFLEELGERSVTIRIIWWTEYHEVIILPHLAV